MPFGWLFAIIVGAVILFMSIYFATQLIKTNNLETNVVTSKDVGIILNPLEIGFESGKVTSLELPVETRFYNNCSEAGNFGKQTIKVSQKSFNAWTENGLEASFENKYIFSENSSEGKNFYVFSKPFELPFKTADLIYLISKTKIYCFIKAPENITKEIRDLKLDNVINATNSASCPQESEKICFTGTSCDVNINVANKILKRNNEEAIKFEGDSLMYAAIFSEKDVYECQLKRLMKRVEILASIYDQKSMDIARKNCNTNLNLVGLEESARKFNSSNDLTILSLISNEIKNANDRAYCKLW